MKTISIHGKEYVPVHERIKEFRNNKKYAGWSLTSEVLSDVGGTITMRASVKNAEGFEVASGTASETQGQGNINRTSHVENCETSAFGRALGCLGIGIDEAFASSNEVENAQNQERKASPTKAASQKQLDLINKLIFEKQLPEGWGQRITEQQESGMTSMQASKTIEELTKLPNTQQAAAVDMFVSDHGMTREDRH